MTCHVRLLMSHQLMAATSSLCAEVVRGQDAMAAGAYLLECYKRLSKATLYVCCVTTSPSSAQGVQRRHMQLLYEGHAGRHAPASPTSPTCISFSEAHRRPFPAPPHPTPPQFTQALSLQSCGDIGDGSCLGGLPSLRRLDLAWCHSVTSQGVSSARASV